jgi:hypothetical protein
MLSINSGASKWKPVSSFRASEEMAQPLPPAGLLDHATIDEMLLVMSWFRRHPDAWRHSVPIERWLAGDAPDPPLDP